jgi:putative SOS response-associated peptidase YedK
MCYHLYTPDTEELISVFEADYALEQEYERYYHNNAFLHHDLPLITQEAPKAIRAYSWGLIPAWVNTKEKALEIRDMTLNATCETVFEKPSFKDSILHKRGIIIAKGFYENRHEGKYKYPYFISAREQSFCFLGGLCQDWADPETGEYQHTCAIITTPANTLMEKIHNTKKRMPLLLAPDQLDQWLDPDATMTELQSLMQPYPVEKMQAHTISRLINQSNTRSTNIPEVCKEALYPELALLDA